jgi:hypothetical protein
VSETGGTDRTWRERLPSLSEVGAKVLETVDAAVEHRWEQALRRADSVAHLRRDRQVKAVSRSIRRELVATGAASGGAAAFPGAGTAVTMASLGGDLVVTTVRLTDLVLTVGAIHGRRDASVEERRLWVLSVLAFGDGAAVAVERISAEVARGLTASSTARASWDLLRGTNRSLARTVLTRYGKQRGAMAFGKLMPFGVGAAIGAGGNAMLVNAVARNADKLMTELPRGGPLAAALPDRGRTRGYT